MRVKCSSTRLSNSLQMISELIFQSTKKPFTTVAYLKVDNNGMTLTATDSRNSVCISLEPDSVLEPGAVFLPYSRISKISQLLDKSSILISTESGKLQLADSNSYFKLDIPIIHDYPEVKFIESANGYISCRSALLKWSVRLVNSVCGQSDRTPIAGIALWRLIQDRLIIVATDGVQLVKTCVPINVIELPEELDYFVLADSMNKLNKLLTESCNEIEFAFSEGNLIIREPRVVFQTPTIETIFPKWEDLFSREITTFNVEVKAWNVLKAIEQIMSLFNKIDALAFRFKTNILQIFYCNLNEEMASIEIPITYNGPDVVIYLDPKLLLSFLRNAIFTDLVIKVKDSNTPVFFKIGENCDYVIMPRTSENWKF